MGQSLSSFYRVDSALHALRTSINLADEKNRARNIDLPATHSLSNNCSHPKIPYKTYKENTFNETSTGKDLRIQESPHPQTTTYRINIHKDEKNETVISRQEISPRNTPRHIPTE